MRATGAAGKRKQLNFVFATELLTCIYAPPPPPSLIPVTMAPKPARVPNRPREGRRGEGRPYGAGAIVEPHIIIPPATRRHVFCRINKARGAIASNLTTFAVFYCRPFVQFACFVCVGLAYRLAKGLFDVA